jgi:hypothetical protein
MREQPVVGATGKVDAVEVVDFDASDHSGSVGL